jgi:hypothetical protein
MVKNLLAHFTARKRGVKGIGNRPPEPKNYFPTDRVVWWRVSLMKMVSKWRQITNSQIRMTKELSNNQMTKPPSPRAFELRILGFFRHYGLGISHSMEMRLSRGHSHAPPV